MVSRSPAVIRVPNRAGKSGSIRSARPSTIACCSRSAASVYVVSPARTANTAIGPTIRTRTTRRPMRIADGCCPEASAYTCHSPWTRRPAFGVRRWRSPVGGGALRGLRRRPVIRRKQPIGSAQQRRQTDEDQVHVGEREDEIRVEHYSLIQQVIDDVEQRRLALIDDAGNRPGRRGGARAQGLRGTWPLRLRRRQVPGNGGMPRAPWFQVDSPRAPSATKL